jgi:acetyltransferase-like isoleucine patch superfamily enzyme
MFTALRKMRQRLFPAEPLCRTGSQSVLYPTASIINALGRRDEIRIGNFCHIRGELFLFGHGGSIEMGDHCYLGVNSRVWSAKKIRIGNRVLISHNCNIFDSDTHPLEPKARHRQYLDIITTGHPREIDLQEEEVVIEDDVLIGANATVLKGVTLGRGAVVGTGSVVTRSVPPFTLVAGNPARVVRELPYGDK